MSNPLDALGGLGGLLSGVTEQMKQMQAQAALTEVEGQAGGGLVKVKANGALEILSVTIAESAYEEREFLEDLIQAATNDALRQAQEIMKGQAGAMAAGLGLPPGLF
jgi:DNA-binding YbaB/EbfC family protein